MKNRFYKYFYHLTSSQLKGVVVLFAILIVLKIATFLVQKTIVIPKAIDQSKGEKFQALIDSLYEIKKLEKLAIKPFNPNFITDYRGEQLQMSLEQIDRLHKFRAQNKYINSAIEFQNVTGVSDEWMNTYSKYFQFPSWVNQQTSTKYSSENSIPKIAKKDINKATIEDLKNVRGIGDILAQRILDERNRFQFFVSIEQLQFVYNISPETFRELKKHFYCTSPQINKLNVNKASVEDLTKIPYFSKSLARQVVILRSKQSEPLNEEDLKKINNFPVEKLQIIALYLEF